jgi:putative transposase
MKDRYRHISLSRFCRLLGITRQAYYQHFWEVEFKTIEESLVLSEVVKIRKKHKHMGGRKLLEKLDSFMVEHKIKMGRDAFFDLLQANGLLVRRKKRRIFTTQSSHWYRKYPNKIKGLTPDRPNQLWVSDITYWKIENGNVYISLITDAFSRKIVGYHVADTLDAIETVQALENALEELKEKPTGLVHHSDRGLQYCSTAYVTILNDQDIEISMTENGDPYENALAERVNGILKEEYLYDYSVSTLNQARQVLDLVIVLYNEDRPHMSCNYKTPEFVHQNMQWNKNAKRII